MGRFLNADALASTGQGLLGNNMFAYCNNNPKNLRDSIGCYPVAEISDNVGEEAVDAVVKGLVYASNPLGTLIGVVLHYSRNLLNKTYSEQELVDDYEPLGADEDKFHQNNQVDGKRNRKYVIGQWFSSEVVFFSDGTINNTPEDIGTFNVYYGDNAFLNVVVHGIFDVIPYMIWGNSFDDSTTIVDRVIMIWEE